MVVVALVLVLMFVVESGGVREVGRSGQGRGGGEMERTTGNKRTVSGYLQYHF